MTIPSIDLVRGFMGVPGWLHELEANVLRASVLSTAPGTAIVEFGRWCGRSLMALAAARAEQMAATPGISWTRRPLVSFDNYPETSQAQEAAASSSQITPHEAKNLAHALAGRFNVGDVWLMLDDAVAGAARYGSAEFKAMIGGDFKVGTLYIDDDHSGERVVAELAAWEPHFADEVEVNMHDFGHEPYGIEAAIDRFMVEHPEWVMVEKILGMARMRRRWKPAPRAQAVPAKVLSCVDTERMSGTATPEYHPESPGPRVSVLYNTWRIGGLDCLRIGLERQTLPPDLFEVVIVDALFPYRQEAVAKFFKDAPYQVKHVNPTRNPFPRDHGNLARNDAIRAASGKVCVWWCDYSMAQPESLERHYKKVERSGWRASSCGHIVYGEIATEALHPAMRVLPWRTIDDYVDFVEGLPADSPLWTSIFKDDIRAIGRARLLTRQNGHGQPYELRGRVAVSIREPIARDTRIDELNGPAPRLDLYYAKNEATAKDVLVAVNGWEESFDDGHASDDMDICRRLNLVGSPFVLDNGNECFVPNPRPFFPLMRWKRTPKENLHLYHTLAGIGRSRAIQGLANELDQIPKPEPVEVGR